MKPQANRVVVPALLFAAILVVSFNAWLAFRSVESLLSSEFWVAHTWQAISQVDRIMGSAKDAETGSRGFLITGDDNYLDPYFSATRDLPTELNHFQSLTSDNPSQQVRLTEMRAVIDQRLALLEQGIDLRRSGDTNSVHALILTGTGKLQMDHLRHIADDMQAEELRLLTLRTATAQSSGRRARYTVSVASGLDFLLIMLMFRYFSHERSLRVAAEITARRLALSRAELEERAREIGSLNALLEHRVQLRTAELETTNRELEAFSYSVSHDLRAPLRTIDGFSLALEEDYAAIVGDTGKDHIRRVRNAVHRMGELIDALLQLSRITRAEILRQQFDISAMAESVAAHLKEENPDNQIAFHIESGLHAFADPQLLRVALENLFGNAVKFSSKMPNTVVDFGWDPIESAWYVRDNGAGFDMIYAEKLFNAFNRLHGDKDFKGSGIGLATVARVVHRHQGRIWANSIVNHGATFWFTLG